MSIRYSYGTAAILLILLCSIAFAENPPGGVVTAEAKFPSPGTKWTVSATDNKGAVTTRTTTVLDDGIHDGRPVYRIAVGSDIAIIDKATRNYVATLREGRERFKVVPHDGTFSFPMWAGKSWKSIYTFYDNVQARSFSNIENTWKVEAPEDLK